MVNFVFKFFGDDILSFCGVYMLAIDIVTREKSTVEKPKTDIYII